MTSSFSVCVIFKTQDEGRPCSLLSLKLILIWSEVELESHNISLERERERERDREGGENERERGLEGGSCEKKDNRRKMKEWERCRWGYCRRGRRTETRTRSDPDTHTNTHTHMFNMLPNAHGHHVCSGVCYFILKPYICVTRYPKANQYQE